MACADAAFATSGSWPTAPIVLKVALMMLWSAWSGSLLLYIIVILLYIIFMKVGLMMLW